MARRERDTWLQISRIFAIRNYRNWSPFAYKMLFPPSMGNKRESSLLLYVGALALMKAILPFHSQLLQERVRE